MIRLGFILAFLFGMYGIPALKGQGNTYDLSYYIEAAIVRFFRIIIIR